MRDKQRQSYSHNKRYNFYGFVFLHKSVPLSLICKNFHF